MQNPDTDLMRHEVVQRLGQGSRLLRLYFPNDDGPDAVLAVNTLYAQEELSRGFRFDVELLSDDAAIPLKDVLGKMMTVGLVRDNGTERFFNGYVTEFRYTKTDGGYVYYYAVLEPWLAFAKLRKDCRSFLGCSVLEMTEQTFLEYRQREWSVRMRGDDPRITCMNQFNETDFNHLHRRWEAAGLYYWYEHCKDGHKLWLSDDSTLAGPIDDCGQWMVPPGIIPYRAFRGAYEGDGITKWQAVRRVGSGNTLLGSFDFKGPKAWSAQYGSANKQGDVQPYDEYDYLGAHAYAHGLDGEEVARRRREEEDRKTQYFEAEGNARAAMPGRRFKLDGHHSGTLKWPERKYVMFRQPIGQREYLITVVRHWAGNNLHSADREPSYYRNELTCLRSTIPWRPGRQFNSERPPAPGTQTAIVTGPPGEDVYTDEYGRVRIQFHWDRRGKHDDGSSPWVRVAMPMAGRQFGQLGVPRVGQEVVVQFLGDNPDRPIVTGVVYNGDNAPPWKLAGQRALSGLRSREFGARRFNQLVLDDTRDQIQVQLRSDHLCSQLALGRIHRLDGNAGHQEHRGDGFELRTDGHGVARAAKGLLLTTEPQLSGTGAVKTMADTIALLTQARSDHEALAQLAERHDLAATGRQTAVAKAVAEQVREIEGTTGELPELSAPHVVVSSAAGIAACAAGSLHLNAGEQVALTAGANVSVAAQGGFFASIREGARLFVHKLGVRLIAASGKVEIRAESDDVEVLAQKVLRLISETDWIELRGRKGVRLHGAGSMIEIADKVQVYSPSPTQFHCNFETLGPQNRPQPAQREQRSDDEKTAERGRKLRPLLQPHSASGTPYTNTPYVLYKDGAEVKTGLTDEQGRIEIDHASGTAGYEVMLGNGDRFALHPDDGAGSGDKAKSNQGYRALNDANDGRDHPY